MSAEQLNGTVALVTGGGQGLGLAFVRAIVENGASVSLLDINEEIGTKAVSRLENECKASAGRILFIKCDITDQREFEDAFRKTIEQFGKINVVINNAGIMTKSVDMWERAIDINYKGVVRGTILGLKYIKNEDYNHSAVINVSSILGMCNSVLPIYQSTKRAVIEFTKSIGALHKLRRAAREEGREEGSNVRIMAICPGPTFDGFENDIERKKNFERRIKMLITSEKEKPDLNRMIRIQSTEYIKTAYLHIMKHGCSGDVWIAENEEPPRLMNASSQY